MSINFPTFVDKEIPSPEKFNDFVQALEALFTAGIGSAEIQWPLVAAGNVIMGDYEITGGTRIMGVVNAAQYSTLQLAMNAANAYGNGAGGIVFIPPNTTIRADGVNLIGSYAAVIGAGPSSVIQLTDGASAGYLLRNTTTGSGTQFLIANLTLDGNGQVGGDGVQLRYAWSSWVHNVTFRNFDGSALKLSNSGTSGQPCTGVRVTNCYFSGGDDHHILADDAINVEVSGCKSSGCDTVAFEFVPLDSAAYIQRINIHDNVFDTADDGCINVRGAGASVDPKWESIRVCDNIIDGTGTAVQPAIRVGASGALVQKFVVSDNQITDPAVDAIDVYGWYGVVADNNCYDAGNDGITLHASKYVSVHGNDVRSAAGVGILATSALTCQIHDNIVPDCSTALAYGATVEKWNNHGSVGVPPASGFYTTATSLTFPANFLHVGDCLDVVSMFSGSAGTGSFALKLDGKFCGATLSSTATGLREIRSRILVDSVSTFHYVALGSVDSRDGSVTSDVRTGMDYTAAVKLLTDGTGLTQDAYSGLFVTISRVEIV